MRAAILAASPHNTQPWLFKVTGSSIELHLDTRRNVGALDPYLREEHLGMGCALENLMVAAPANGYAATAILLPGNSAQFSLNRNQSLWPGWTWYPVNENKGSFTMLFLGDTPTEVSDQWSRRGFTGFE